MSESIQRLALLMVSLTLILYITASQFDVSEIKTIVLWFLSAATVEGGLGVVKSFNSKPKE